MVADSIDTAFTDFTRHEKFQVDYAGQHWSDSDAEFACIKRAVDNGVPFLDGGYLAKITRADLNKVFEGNIEMPMLDEKLEVLHQVGAVLAEKYDGRFHNFVKSCSPKLYDNGNGLIDRLVKEFPRFNDVSMLDGHEIKFYKLAQLGVWMLYATLHEQGKFRLDDPQKMTAFADYIVPLALRLHGITSYSEKLEKAINSHELIPRDSRWEIEIRAHCIYATAVLTEEINKRRPANLQVIIPQIDARFWTHFHTTTWPHHLTRTIMY
jgi:Potential Queuosine, Q, salvage protein family